MASTKSKRGFMRKAADAMISGRTRHAVRYTTGMDAPSLRTLGLMNIELRKPASGYRPL
jgi:hypothetical protein